MPGRGEAWEYICYTVVIVRLGMIRAIVLRYKQQELRDASGGLEQLAEPSQLSAHAVGIAQ
jgi:hypothetical protein